MAKDAAARRETELDEELHAAGNPPSDAPSARGLSLHRRTRDRSLRERTPVLRKN